MAIIPTLCAILLANQATPSKTVPFRVTDSAMIVDAVVNGKPSTYMFDTGFGAAIQVSENVNIGKPTGSMTLKDFVGTFEAPTVKIKSLKLGDMDIDTKDLPEAIMGREDMTESYGMHCDGLMGFAVIKNNITGINFQKKQFEFYSKSVDISKWTPDNKRTFLLRMLPTGHSSVELSVEASNGQKMILALDTGNGFYATTHRDVLERIGLWKAGTDPKFVKQSWVASGPVDSWDLKMKNIKIFGVPVAESVWNIIDLPSSSAEGDGTIGFGFLKNFNIIIDYDRRRVWLENWTGKVAEDEQGNPGLVAGADRGGDIRVYRVLPGSPAEKAGIKVGDKLIAIDGKDLDYHIGWRKLERLLAGPVGSKVNLAYSQGGNLKRLEVERAGLYNVTALD